MKTRMSIYNESIQLRIIRYSPPPAKSWWKVDPDLSLRVFSLILIPHWPSVRHTHLWGRLRAPPTNHLSCNSSFALVSLKPSCPITHFLLASSHREVYYILQSLFVALLRRPISIYVAPTCDLLLTLTTLCHFPYPSLESLCYYVWFLFICLFIYMFIHIFILF